LAGAAATVVAAAATLTPAAAALAAAAAAGETVIAATVAAAAARPEVAANANLRERSKLAAGKRRSSARTLVLARRREGSESGTPETLRYREAELSSLDISLDLVDRDSVFSLILGEMEAEPEEEAELDVGAGAAKAPAAATEEWSEEIEREELAEPEAKRCPVCLSSNTQSQKDNFSKFITCNSCYTIH